MHVTRVGSGRGEGGGGWEREGGGKGSRGGELWDCLSYAILYKQIVLTIYLKHCSSAFVLLYVY